MKVFITGLPKSGRSTVAKALAEKFPANSKHINITSWIKSFFRPKELNESLTEYEEAFHQFIIDEYKKNPLFVWDYINAQTWFIKDKYNYRDYNLQNLYILDGVSSPFEFVQSFNYKRDMVIFLNRTDNDADIRDCDNIATSIIRDYCFWLASADLLDKNRWLEYNFKIPGDDSDFVKAMGAKNSVFIIKSFAKLISHLSDKVGEQYALSK